MAKTTGKIPADKTTGTLGKVDRSVGREGALRNRLMQTKNGTVLGLKTDRTKTRSPGQIARAAIYCSCDEEWKAISAAKKQYLGPYWVQILHNLTMHKTNYLIWMSICMRSGPYKLAWLKNDYVARYIISNSTPDTWTNKILKLTGLNCKNDMGLDIEIYTISTKNEISGTLTYKEGGKNSAYVEIPTLNPQKTITIDIYHHGDYANPGTLNVQSEAELDQSMLNQSGGFGYDHGGLHTVNVAFTAEYTGPLYMAYFDFYCGSGTQINLETNTPKNEKIGSTGKSFYGLPISIWGFGLIETGKFYRISGHIIDPGSERCTCGDPAGYAYIEWNYGGPFISHSKYYTPGYTNACFAPWFTPYRMIQLEATEYPTFNPSSTTQIGPL